MASPIDIISRALKDIGALEAGEVPTADAAQDAFDMLNDLCDQWSNEEMMVYYKNEIVFPITPGVTQYTIGPTGTINASITGSITGNILTITGINSGAINVGQTLGGTGIIAGTIIEKMLTGAGNSVNESGTYQLNQYYTTPIISETITLYYQRPLSIDSAFVRINTNSNGVPIVNGGLDYPIAILAVEDYQMIGLKTLNGPWPKALYYQPSETLGNIYVWPNPSQGEMHIFTDNLFQRYTSLQDSIVLPQGYTMALRWNLAERLMPMYGKASPVQIAMIQQYAAQGKATVKRINMKPVQSARFADAMLSSRQKDAGWILSGGFFR
jgi:hypothetical protein